MVPGTQIQSTTGALYYLHPHHRESQRRFEKSQWIIGCPEEVRAFTSAHTGGWVAKANGYGYHAPSANGPQPLGETTGQEPTYIAKFVGSGSPLVWHGYPADPTRNTHDRPPAKTLVSWMQQGATTKARMAKIIQGKSCKL